MVKCPKCGNDIYDLMLDIEYAFVHPEHYDGVSERKCMECGTRWGRWSGRVLLDGEVESRKERFANE